MSSTWFPPGWTVGVENPGFGELYVEALTRPFRGTPLVTEDWTKELKGAEIGVFTRQITARALDDDDMAPVPADKALPAFITPHAAGALLLALQEAVVLAVAGPDRAERIYVDEDDPPPKPLCVRCNLGTNYSPPGVGPSEWCERHGHRPFGWGTDARWAIAQDLYRIRRQRWDAEQKWNTLMADHRAAIAPRPIR